MDFISCRLIKFVLILFTSLSASCAQSNTEDEAASASAHHHDAGRETVANEVQSPIFKYKHLFTSHRNTQLEAVKRIVSYDDNTRRYELVNMMLKQIFKVTEESKQNLTSWGFLPGDPFPENITILEGVTKIFENTALFGDMVLRLPDIVHDLYDHKKEWNLLLAWAYGFCLQSDVFEGPSMQLLNLMAQEVNIIPQEPNYFNPYKEVNKNKKKHMDGTVEKPRKKLKKIQRGPRMSHTEL